MPDHSPFCFTVLKPRNGCGDRDDADGEDILADQTINERAFPGFELAQNDHVNGWVLRQQAFRGFQLAFQGDELKTDTYITDRLQQVPDLGQCYYFIGLFHKKTPPG